ncbi:MAG: PhzF family phenazine biosynthesis protein [Acidimicrobiia bacterium]
MTLLLQIDAFTDRAFGGNPAAVCLLDDPSDDAHWMQAVAAEMNLSETAFVTPRPDGQLDLRWFTPTVEVDLCGHATLASAHALWESGRLAGDQDARFQTRSGLLVATQGVGGIEMDFPARPVASAIVAGLEALGAPHAPLGTFDNGHQLVVELHDEAAVRATTPDFPVLGRAADRVWVVTAPAPANSDADFVSRCFGPRYGIDEDPVTGSAHCALAPFWAERFGRDTLVGHQISARGGRVSVHLRGDRVTLGGGAVTVLRGELLA